MGIPYFPKAAEVYMCDFPRRDAKHMDEDVFQGEMVKALGPADGRGLDLPSNLRVLPRQEIRSNTVMVSIPKNPGSGLSTTSTDTTIHPPGAI